MAPPTEDFGGEVPVEFAPAYDSPSASLRRTPNVLVHGSAHAKGPMAVAAPGECGAVKEAMGLKNLFSEESFQRIRPSMKVPVAFPPAAPEIRAAPDAMIPRARSNTLQAEPARNVQAPPVIVDSRLHSSFAACCKVQAPPVIVDGRLHSSNADASQSARHPFYTWVGPRQLAQQSSERDVLLNLYHCDKLTGLLNEAVLLQADLPIYHVGVETWGREWCFQYFHDAWKDQAFSGIKSCMPKEARGYEYIKSINLGPTSLSDRDVWDLLFFLRPEWPAYGYHLTRRNCVSFAEILTEKLQSPLPFPPWIRGIHDASANSPSADAIVGYSWDLSKWLMEMKDRHEATNGIPLCRIVPQEPARNGEADEGSTWSSCLNVPAMEMALM